MKTCAKCGLENPSSALHCMGCGALLVEKEKLTEEQKLQNKNKELEKENELLKAALEASLKGAMSSTDNLASIDEDSLSDDALLSDDDVPSDDDTDDVNLQTDEDAPQSISDDKLDETSEKGKITIKDLLITTFYFILLLLGIALVTLTCS